MFSSRLRGSFLLVQKPSPSILPHVVSSSRFYSSSSPCLRRRKSSSDFQGNHDNNNSNNNSIEQTLADLNLENEKLRRTVQLSKDTFDIFRKRLDDISTQMNDIDEISPQQMNDDDDHQAVDLLLDETRQWSPGATLKILANSKSPELIWFATKKIEKDFRSFGERSSYVSVDAAAALLKAIPNATIPEACENIFEAIWSVAYWCLESRDAFSSLEAVEIISDAAIKNARTCRAVEIVTGAIYRIVIDDKNRAKNFTVNNPKCLTMFATLIPRVKRTDSAGKVWSCISHLIRLNEQEALAIFGTRSFQNLIGTMLQYCKDDVKPVTELIKILDDHIVKTEKTVK